MKREKELSKLEVKVVNCLQKMINQITDVGFDKDMFAEAYAEILNDGLDNLLDDDFFGTEGQLDPRGDQREKGHIKL